MKIAQYFWH